MTVPDPSRYAPPSEAQRGPTDVEAALVRYFREDPHVAALTSGNVAGELPDNFDTANELPFLRLFRVGGNFVDGNTGRLERARVQLDCWARTKAEAFDLANVTVRCAFDLAAGIDVAGLVFTDVRVELGPTWSPDPETDLPRYLLTLAFFAHPRTFPDEAIFDRFDRPDLIAATFGVSTSGHYWRRASSSASPVSPSYAGILNGIAGAVDSAGETDYHYHRLPITARDGGFVQLVRVAGDPKLAFHVRSAQSGLVAGLPLAVALEENGSGGLRLVERRAAVADTTVFDTGADGSATGTKIALRWIGVDVFLDVDGVTVGSGSYAADFLPIPGVGVWQDDAGPDTFSEFRAGGLIADNFPAGPTTAFPSKTATGHAWLRPSDITGPLGGGSAEVVASATLPGENAIAIDADPAFVSALAARALTRDGALDFVYSDPGGPTGRWTMGIRGAFDLLGGFVNAGAVSTSVASGSWVLVVSEGAKATPSDPGSNELARLAVTGKPAPPFRVRMEFVGNRLRYFVGLPVGPPELEPLTATPDLEIVHSSALRANRLTGWLTFAGDSARSELYARPHVIPFPYS